jgi:hypothetical protein
MIRGTVKVGLKVRPLAFGGDKPNEVFALGPADSRSLCPLTRPLWLTTTVTEPDPSEPNSCTFARYHFFSSWGHYPPREGTSLIVPDVFCLFNCVCFVGCFVLERLWLCEWRASVVCEGKRWQAGWLGRWQAGGVGEQRQKLGGLLLLGILCDILRQRAEVQDRRCRCWSTQPMQTQPQQT